MPHKWPQGFSSEYFSPKEFDHPELMDGEFVLDLDELRERCGFALTIMDDARTFEELRALYTKEIKAGLPWASDSPHLYKDGHPVRSVDLKPKINSVWARMKLVSEILKMHLEFDYFPHLGLIIETAHIHLDDTPRLKGKRPYFGVGVSK